MAQEVEGVGRIIPAIKWSDKDEVTCPRLNLQQFQDRTGVWFIHTDASGAFDSYRSEFWELGTAKLILAQVQRAEPLSPELQALRRAIELSCQSPAG